MTFSALARLFAMAGLAACAAPSGKGETVGLPFSQSARLELERLHSDLQSAPVQTACSDEERRRFWVGTLLFGVAAEADEDPGRWGWTRQSAPLSCWINAIDAGKDVRRVCPQPRTPLDSRLLNLVVEYQSLGGGTTAITPSCSKVVSDLM